EDRDLHRESIRPCSGRGMRHLPPLHKDSGPDQERPRRAGRGRTGDDAIKPLGSRARIRKIAAKLAGHLAPCRSKLLRSLPAFPKALAVPAFQQVLDCWLAADGLQIQSHQIEEVRWNVTPHRESEALRSVVCDRMVVRPGA